MVVSPSLVKLPGLGTGFWAKKALRQLQRANRDHSDSLELLWGDITRAGNSIQPVYLIDFDLIYRLMYPYSKGFEPYALLTRKWLLNSNCLFAIPAGTYAELVDHLRDRASGRLGSSGTRSKLSGFASNPWLPSIEPLTDLAGETSQTLGLELLDLEEVLSEESGIRDLMSFISRPNVGPLENYVDAEHLLEQARQSFPEMETAYLSLVEDLYTQRRQLPPYTWRREAGANDKVDALNLFAVLTANAAEEAKSSSQPHYYYALATATPTILKNRKLQTYQDWVSDFLDLPNPSVTRPPSFFAYWQVLCSQEPKINYDEARNRTADVMTAIEDVNKELRLIPELGRASGRFSKDEPQAPTLVFDLRNQVLQAVTSSQRLPQYLATLYESLSNPYLIDIEHLLIQDWDFARDCIEYRAGSLDATKKERLFNQLGRRPFEFRLRDELSQAVQLILHEATTNLEAFLRAARSRHMKKATFFLTRPFEEVLNYETRRPADDCWSIQRTAEPPRIAARYEDGFLSIIWPTSSAPQHAVSSVPLALFDTDEPVTFEVTWLDEKDSPKTATGRGQWPIKYGSIKKAADTVPMAFRLETAKVLLTMTLPDPQGAVSRIMIVSSDVNRLLQVPSLFSKTYKGYIPNPLVEKWLREILLEKGLQNAAEEGRI